MTIPTHPPGQGVAFPAGLEVSSGPLVLTVTATFQRLPRRRCGICGNRRVCFAIVAGDDSSIPMCARCAGIR